MLRSGTVNRIQGLASEGKSIHEIGRHLGLARNTVRKYLRGSPPALARPAKGSKLDPFKAQIHRWVQDDHLYNCETMLPRLQTQGYAGGMSILKAFVAPLRPPRAGQQPVRRYETAPGEQMQFDWGEFGYEHEGRAHKVYGFIAILSYSRMRFVTFVKRCDAPTMIRCLMAALEYFGGLPRAVLTDRMKSVLLSMDGRTPQWQPLFADFVATLGVAPRVCKAYTPQTKGKVERSVSVVKHSFWPGVTFTDLDDLNRQGRAWCVQHNQRPHRTIRQPPVERWVAEGLAPLPTGFAWDRFGTEERKVSWDGYVSYDGVLYGVPSEPAMAGRHVQVREQQGQLTFWFAGQLVVQVTKRPTSQDIVPHHDQFRTVPTVSAARQGQQPVGHQVAAPTVACRPLSDYDQLCGVEGLG